MLISLHVVAARSRIGEPREGLHIRRPLAPEHDLVTAWVSRHFTPGWASEARTALSHRPCGVFIAVEADSIVGFCCIDAIARGFVGPIGVAPEFFRRVAGAVEIPGSSPGLYAGLLKG